MEYTVHQLAQLAGVTVRTLHHYDQIGILRPQKRQENGYRLYGEDEVDILQQILLYREIGFTLQQIKEIMNDPDYSRAEVLSEQLDALIHKRNRLEQTIATVQRTLRMMEREEILSDEDKFIGLKHSIVEMNEKAFGRELRTRFGDEIIDGANQKMVSLNTGNGMIYLYWKDAFLICLPRPIMKETIKAKLQWKPVNCTRNGYAYNGKKEHILLKCIWRL